MRRRQAQANALSLQFASWFSRWLEIDDINIINLSAGCQDSHVADLRPRFGNRLPRIIQTPARLLRISHAQRYIDRVTARSRGARAARRHHLGAGWRTEPLRLQPQAERRFGWQAPRCGVAASRGGAGHAAV